MAWRDIVVDIATSLGSSFSQLPSYHNGFVYIPNGGTGKVCKIDATTDTEVAVLDLSYTGHYAGTCVENNTLWVVSGSPSKMFEIDLGTFTVTNSYALSASGSTVRSIDQDETYIYTFHQGNGVNRFHKTTHASALFVLAADNYGACFDGTHLYYVAGHSGPTLYKLLASTMTLIGSRSLGWTLSNSSYCPTIAKDHIIVGGQSVGNPIRIIRKSDMVIVSSKTQSGGYSARGITTDGGRYVYNNAMFGAYHAYRLDTQTMSFTETATAEAQSSSGLCGEGNFIWSAGFYTTICEKSNVEETVDHPLDFDFDGTPDFGVIPPTPDYRMAVLKDFEWQPPVAGIQNAPPA